MVQITTSGDNLAVSLASPSQGSDTNQPANTQPLLQDRVARTVRRYLADLDDTECEQGLYELLVNEVEYPMLVEVMKWHDGNQSRAACTLGINRATLRKKLLHHGLI